jgi:aminoglycoside phosphotransferase family enzyme/predicted kinase
MDASLIETHVSVVLFLGDHAYKLKKPVRFPFADLSTREARQALCIREVELNRRLAPDVYEGVADVLGPDGTLCDHLVVMRRMPADRRLSELVAAADPRVGPAIDELAHLLAGFHRSADRSAEIDTAARRDAIADRWLRNEVQMRSISGSGLDPAVLARALMLADRFLSGREVLFDHRIADGRVCDGHGDLLADDIFLLDDGPRVLDCIEFDDELRHVDVVDDLAFLVMDLEHLGAPHLGEALVDAYERASGDDVPRGLLHFCVAYRAQVRALVAALRAAQCEDPEEQARCAAEAARHLDQCVRRLERGAVRLILVGGLPGTGKTTVATGIGEQGGWTVLHSDLVRKALAGIPGDESASAPFNSGIYTAEMTDRTYDAMLSSARRLLMLGESVVLDASFVSGRHRAAARSLAAETTSELVELRCTLDPEAAAQRIRQRMARGDDASDADPAVAVRLAGEIDPWPESFELATDPPPETIIGGAVREVLTRPGPGPGDRLGDGYGP